MEKKVPVDTWQADPQARRQRVLEAIRQHRPMSIWGQLVVLLFMAAMVLFITLANELRNSATSSFFISSSLIIAIFFVAMNAMRAQRQLNALVEVVTQSLEKP